MAKINRVNGNVQAFASAALGTERTVFGEVTQSNDLTDQFTADFLRGWGIVGPSDQPALEDFNAVAYTLSQILAYLHQMGVAEYNAAQEYPINGMCNVSGVIYVSKINANIGNNPVSSPSQWGGLYAQATETVTGIAEIATQAEVTTGTDDARIVTPLKLRAAQATTVAAQAGTDNQTLMTPLRTFQAIAAYASARIDVASTANINLSTAAPFTQNINITGTAGITGFTVATGKYYFVRFAAALLITNSASLVTQSGANITTAAGDTCIIRATAANVVEILCYTPAIPQEIGYRQTWQSVLGSRLINTAYTNTTGRPIVVSVTIAARAGNEDFAIVVDGVTVASLINLGTAGEYNWLSAVVPAGSTYNINAFVGAVINMIAELR